MGSGRLLRLRQLSLGSQLKLQNTEKGNENKKLDLCYKCINVFAKSTEIKCRMFDSEKLIYFKESPTRMVYSYDITMM